VQRFVRMLAFAISIVIAFWWGAFTSHSATRPSPPPADPIARMSLAEKAGQLVMTRIGGTALSDGDRALLSTSHIGGVILFSDNYRDAAQLRALTDEIQQASVGGNGPLIAIDQEGGVVKRLAGLPPWYSASQIGSSGSSALAFGQGMETGKALRALGITMDLAPVADLDEGPAHVMGSRSFGALPVRAGRLSSAFARGLQSAHVAATLKHFPGLGGATINSDDGKAYVYRTAVALAADLIPFRFGIASHAQAIMVSHGMYVNAYGPLPASINPTIATTLLRQRMGFTGVAISDSLNSIAWRFGGDVAAACPATIASGVDIALITGDAETARECADRIVEAVHEGTLLKPRLDEAVSRVLAMKRWLGL